VKRAKSVEVRSMEGLGVAVCHSKCNTFLNEVGRVGETATFLNRQEVEGEQWDIGNSPKTKDTPWLG
jgi:hypothetical protein